MLTLEELNETAIIHDDHRIESAIEKIRENISVKNLVVLGWRLRLTRTCKCVANTPRCKNCGDELGKIAVTRVTHNSFRFKFFTEDDINLTKDHVIPASRGGTSHRYNLQTLCYFCNEEKGNEFNGTVEKVLSAKHVRLIFNHINRPDLIDLMVDQIKRRKKENQEYPTLFRIEEFLQEFPIFTRDRLFELFNEVKGDKGELPYYEVAKSQLP